MAGDGAGPEGAVQRPGDGQEEVQEDGGYQVKGRKHIFDINHNPPPALNEKSRNIVLSSS